MKKLGAKALDICAKGREGGLKQKEIVKKLVAQGYTSETGRTVDQSAVSRFMRKHGLVYRTTNRKKHTRKRKTVTKQPRANILKDMEDILTSNLSESLKKQLVVVIAKQVK